MPRTLGTTRARIQAFAITDPSTMREGAHYLCQLWILTPSSPQVMLHPQIVGINLLKFESIVNNLSIAPKYQLYSVQNCWEVPLRQQKIDKA